MAKFTFRIFTNYTDDINFVCEDFVRYELNELNNKKLNNQKINNQHDKIFRKVLSNKKEATFVINKAIKISPEIQLDEIQEYKSSFVNDFLENKEADIVYKLKGSNIFFLIEHQSKIDYSMVYRIQNYKFEIMKNALDLNKVRTKDYKIPVVIPIVLYTGREKWNAEIFINKIEDERFKSIDFLKYNLIDINNYNNEDFLKSDSFIEKIMLIEKSKGWEELVNNLDKIILSLNNKQDKKFLISIIDLTLREKIGDTKANNLIKRLKGEDDNMLAVLEMIREENKMLIEQGKKEGKIENNKEIAKKMLNEKMPIKLISKILRFK